MKEPFMTQWMVRRLKGQAKVKSPVECRSVRHKMAETPHPIRCCEGRCPGCGRWFFRGLSDHREACKMLKAKVAA